MQRELLDAAAVEVAPSDILTVKTQTQLLDALQNGHQDIEIREHLDVSEVTTSRLLAHVFSTTRSIRVRQIHVSLIIVHGNLIVYCTSSRVLLEFFQLACQASRRASRATLGML